MKKLILSCLLSLLLGRGEATVRDLGETCSRTDDSCVHPEQKLVCDRLTSTCVLAVNQSCGRHGQTSVGTEGLCVSGASCSLSEDGRSVCTCGKAGYTPTDGHCDIGAEMYGGACNGDDCFDHTLTCRNTTDKRCDCVKGRKPNIGVTATCTENFMFKGALCSVREECSATNVNAYECVSGRCECALGYNALYNEECVEITDLVAGKRCDQNSGSGCGEQNKTHLQCSPADGVCTCVGGYVGLTGNECYPAAGELHGGCTASTPGTRGSCLRERDVCIQDDIDGPVHCQDLCLLPKVTGMCRAYFPSFYYNSEKGACEDFVYGGCQGNSNRFSTKEGCEETCVDDICLLSKAEGPCEASIPSYFHNRETGACEQFNYGGCEGNENRFGTEEECQAACVKDKCQLPKDTGPCRAYIPSYFHNRETGACEQFIYGGCQGNENRFETEEECQAACVPDVCELPPESGMCMAYFPMYFYNSTSEACEEFVYGGCGGNDNRFDSKTQCEKTCGKDVCELPPESGMCMAYFPMYFYNSTSEACEEFIYGGCQGNDNRFDNKTHCEKACGKDICRLPKDTGPCRASEPRFFYNWETGACEQFSYGGCLGNENRFETEEECQVACVTDVCQLPQITGPCRASIPSYSYNSETGACEQFTYGGCQGNGNRFGTEEECQAACVKDVCQLPQITGPCRASIPSYSYNLETGTCEQFIYGGCQGNDNRFGTEEECQAACVKDTCQLPKESGPCEAYMPSYFYNRETGACEQFIYGGCQGNENRFGTEEECRAACVKELGRCMTNFPLHFYNSTSGVRENVIYGGCGGNNNRFDTKTQCQKTCRKDPCQQPKQPGKCRGYFPRYFYNSASKTCENFVYGGCGGNENNFESLRDCRHACQKEIVCQQPKRSGRCEAFIRRYFYNTEANECEDFIYGGCDGNDNNFEDKIQCQLACRKDTDGSTGLHSQMVMVMLAVIVGWSFVRL